MYGLVGGGFDDLVGDVFAFFGHRVDVSFEGLLLFVTFRVLALLATRYSSESDPLSSGRDDGKDAFLREVRGHLA